MGFVQLDDDFSGKICYHELEDMVRNELLVPVTQFSEEQLQAIWRALDEDHSGLITCGEFGNFMRKGLAALEDPGETGAQPILRLKKAQGSGVRKDLEHMR